MAESLSGFPPSWYAATLNDETRRSALAGEEAADICVIGGGFAGVSSAIFLAERGYSVVLLEAARIGWGASGRNGGQLCAGFLAEDRLEKGLGPTHSRLIRDLAYRGHEIIRDRVDRFAIDCDLTFGHITVANKPRQMRALEAHFEEHQAMGLGEHVAVTDATETARLVGTGAYCGGFVNRLDGHLHPLNLVRGEARGAESLGVRIFENSPVESIERTSAGPEIRTSAGIVRAKAAIVAGNAYHRLERRKMGGYVFPAGSYLIVTDPLDAEARDRISPERLAVYDSNNIIDYYRMTPDGRMLFGGLCNYTNRDPSNIDDALRPRMERLWPELARVKTAYQWGGKIGIVISRIPRIGRLDGDVYYLEGFSGHGINTTHIFSEIVAEAIGGTLERFDAFARLPQIRIPGGVFGNQILALGMMWYKLRDMM